jgi:hypothetical protein
MRLENMKNLFPCSGTGILGVATVLEIRKKGQRLNSLRHHVHRPFETIHELLDLSGRRIRVLQRGNQV